MGFYLRKSAKIGPFRLNLSKSGIGISAGVRGFRVSTGPRGAMVHMGRHGIYYRKSLGRQNKLREQHPAIPPKELVPDQDNLKQIDSTSADQIIDSNSKEIIDLIRQTRHRFPYKWLSLPLLALVFIKPILILIGVLAFIALIIIDVRRRTAHIAYDITEDFEKDLQQFYDELGQLFSSNRIWHISAEGGISDWKKSGGASKAVKRKAISIVWGKPKGINTNVRVPALPVGAQILYFLPDMVLVVEGNKIGAVSYSELHSNESTIRFIEEETRPSDGKLVGNTWKYVNKSGGPDRRFKDNYQIPIFEYLQIELKSDTGLHEMIQVSNCQHINKIGNALRNAQVATTASQKSEQKTV